MAQGARTREEPVVAQWKLPRRGVIKSISDLEIPPDALYSASNVEILDGYLMGRKGLTAHTSQVFTGVPTGAINFWEDDTASWVVVAMSDAVWTLELATSTWTNRGGSLTGSIDNPSSMAQYAFGSPLANRVYICNGKDAMKYWKPGDATVTAVAGTPPIFKAITVAADRIVGLVGSHSIQWLDGLPADDASLSWPAANTRILAETPGPTTAIMSLGTLGFAVYKRDSIWAGEVTGLAGASAFRLTMVDQIDGPAGPNALVNANGKHIYMSKDGRIGMYNGVTHKWIADGVWEVVKSEIDKTKPNRIHGVFIPQLDQVRFFYKRTGGSNTDGLVILQMEIRDLQVPFAGFPGRMGKHVTAGCTISDTVLDTSLVFNGTASSQGTWKIDGTSDDGTSISSHIQTGLSLVKNLEVSRALSYEPIIERLAGYGSITAKLVSSNIIDSIGGTLSTGATVDLTATPVKNHIGFDVRGRFLGSRLEWTNSATVRYRGGVLRGSETL